MGESTSLPTSLVFLTSLTTAVWMDGQSREYYFLMLVLLSSSTRLDPIISKDGSHSHKQSYEPLPMKLPTVQLLRSRAVQSLACSVKLIQT